MKVFNRTVGGLILLGSLLLLLAGCSSEPAVSFSQDVKPILDQNCIRCHQPGGKGEQASGFDVTTYDKLMKGTRFGPMVIAGDAQSSNLVVLIEGRADPSLRMPHLEKDPLAPEDILTIRSWIDQGAVNN